MLRPDRWDVHFDEIPWGVVHFEKGCFTQSLFLYLLSAFSFYFFVNCVFHNEIKILQSLNIVKATYLFKNGAHTYLN